MYCLVLNDYYNWVDECLLAYGLVCFSCLIILVGSSWWIIQAQQARPVFVTVVAVTAGIFLTNAIQFVARFLFISGGIGEYGRYITSSLWHWRNVPELIALIYLGAIVVSRLWEIEEKRGE